MNAQNLTTNREFEAKPLPGALMLPVLLLFLIGNIALFIYAATHSEAVSHSVHGNGNPLLTLSLIVGIPLEVAGFVMLSGLFTLQPNQARVLILFGAYKGTVRSSGFFWANPFYANGARMTMQVEGGKNVPQIQFSNRQKISLRARTLNMEKIKVNDKGGNPIEIAAVIIWRVQDTAQATFDVENYEGYVTTQSESSLRHLASSYSYDHGAENEVTLRSGMDEVSNALRKELQERLEKAGVVVDEARLTHLAYAPEIAQAMLRRQQAEAVIDARQKIVQGAVSMVDMALKALAEKQVVHLDDERKAAMVSNLMVVLCGEAEVHPVINAGTLYN